jgi:hypothetical protein
MDKWKGWEGWCTTVHPHFKMRIFLPSIDFIYPLFTKRGCVGGGELSRQTSYCQVDKGHLSIVKKKVQFTVNGMNLLNVMESPMKKYNCSAYRCMQCTFSPSFFAFNYF